MTTKIVPNIWCNGNARELAEFYSQVFRNTAITGSQQYPTEGLPDFQQHMAGKDVTVDIDIDGLPITLINADDTFRPNPSLGFMVNFDQAQFEDATDYLDQAYEQLKEGGRVLMELGEYPFSKRYAWVEDKAGVSWQLIMTRPENDPRPHIIPAFMFCGDAQGKCAEAVDYYCDVIPNSAVGRRVMYPHNPAEVMFSEFQLAGQWFTAMDSGVPQDFGFTGGVALLINAKDQEEIDYLWSKLAAQEQPCGWCIDKFGVAWEVIPENFGELMAHPDSYSAMMGMKKIVIADFPR
ncbi:VOC family protein [Corynebacterium sp. H130]|uniref:VOC family protein n=1 Tax=Corynebacterium sp. H130 TaxID=3133444 RepID=UPI00309FDF06